MKLKLKAFTALALLCSAFTMAAEEAPSLLKTPLKDIEGKTTSLEQFRGKTILVVNVASRCGLTPQYDGLQKIHEKYKDKGFTVVAFPCNDFGKQEPGTNKEIVEFCESTYQVTFPLMDKIHVKGPEKHPLYKILTEKPAPFPGDIEWNFGKFLIGPDGKVLKRFRPQVTPESEEVTKAIEASLSTKSA